jgi:hypothetical protein
MSSKLKFVPHLLSAMAWAGRWAEALIFCIVLAGSQGGFAQNQSPNESKPSTRAQASHVNNNQAPASRPNKHVQHVVPKTVQPIPMEEPSSIELSPELMAISEQVQSGHMPCELGQSVTLNPIPNSPGQFALFFKNNRYALIPTLSHTGAIRLEDPKQGAVWIQLANKSMLFNTRLGQRMVDECKSKDQELVALHQRNSPPVQLLSAVNGADEQR